MDWLLDILLYLILWWLVFFAVLPFGVKAIGKQHGLATSAPENPHMGKKVLVTTFITLFLWWGVRYALDHRWIPLDTLMDDDFTEGLKED